MNPSYPKMVNEELATKMKIAIAPKINKEMTGPMPNKEILHAANTALLSNSLEGKEYPVILLGIANKINKGERKVLVEAYRQDAHKMWEEMFGTYPPCWKQDANDKEEPFLFAESGIEQFAEIADKVYKERIETLNADNCRRAAFMMTMIGLASLLAGSMTLPIVFNGIGWQLWNGGDETLLNDLHDDAKEYWNKYFRKIDCPYNI